MEWSDADGVPVDLETTTIDGQYWISELCRAGGTVRLFDPLSFQPEEIRVYDLMGRRRPEIGPGWNIILWKQGPSLQVERRYVQQ